MNLLFSLSPCLFFVFHFISIQQNSSVEGVFAPQRSTHPFRIIENDTMSIQSMTSLGRVGRILAGTIDVTNSIADKDTQSTNASSIIDCNVMTATTSNTTTTMSSMGSAAATAAASGGGDTMSSERKAKSTTSCNLNDSSTSSNDNTSNNAMSLQGKPTIKNN